MINFGMDEISRRKFLEFMGRSSLGLGLLSLSPLALQGCTSLGAIGGRQVTGLPFSPLLPMVKDDLVVASGFESRVLISWNEALAGGEHFGYNNDYIGVIPLADSKTDAYMWVNHETADPQFVSGHQSYDKTTLKTRAQAELEMRAIGGSLLHVRLDEAGDWQVVKGSAIHKRYHAKTEIPFAGGVKVLGRPTAMGTLANCSGGVTPWKTFLTCEENFHHFYGDVSFSASGARTLTPARASQGWTTFYDNPPEHYGWVVEIDPRTRAAHKLTSLGRFAHEGATCQLARDGRAVVYMGDDSDNEFFYKFIARDKGSLVHGTLYVADLKKGKWLPLDLTQSPSLQKHFKSQLDVMIRVREAARLLGGTPLDRPEDCEVDPVTGAIIVACTNNKPAGRPFGSLLKIDEENGDFLALKFRSEFWKMGGEQTGFACPDNLCFDPAGNLWMTTDIADDALNKDEYAFHGNNALFVIPMKGNLAGQAFRVASAPMEAEFTGPCFSPDGGTLFLSVQHPGANSKGPTKLTSNWPDGGNAVPKPSVVAIRGSALKALTGA